MCFANIRKAAFAAFLVAPLTACTRPLPATPQQATTTLRQHCETVGDDAERAACLAAVDALAQYCHGG